MPDKYHNEWIIRDIATECRIVKGQIRAFKFLSGMADDLDDAIEMLEGIENISAIDLHLELLKRKCFYLHMANGVGRLWSNEPKGASGA